MLFPAVYCPALSLTNTSEVDTYNTSFDTVANVSCSSGYAMPDNSTWREITCLPSGMWDAASHDITCERMLCHSFK